MKFILYIALIIFVLYLIDTTIGLELFYILTAITIIIFAIIKKKKEKNNLKKDTRINNQDNLENNLEKNGQILDSNKNYKEIEKTDTIIEKTIKNDEINKNTIKITSIKDKSKEEIERYLKSNDILYEIPNMLIYDYSEDSPTILLNLLCKKNSNYNLNFIILDTLKLTFLDFKNFSYLPSPIITNFNRINITLKDISIIIKERSILFEKYNCKNIKDFNELCLKISALNEIPYLYIIINDLIDISRNKETSDMINNLVLKGKIVGIKLIMFSKVEKKYLNFKIIDNYVEKYTIDEIINKIKTDFNGLNDIKEENNKKLEYTPSNPLYNNNNINNYNSELEITEEYDDPIYKEIVDFAISTGKISAALIQRRFRLGYNRAARLIDLLEERGVIGPPNGSKPREVLIKNTTNNP